MMKTLNIALFLIIVLLGGTALAQPYQYLIDPDEDALVKTKSGTNFATTNFGNEEDFTAAYVDDGGDYLTERALMKFDLSSLPNDADIGSAYLELEGVDHLFDNDNDGYLKLITSSWAEGSVTWNNQPSTTTSEQVELMASSDAEEDYRVDVTDAIIALYDNPSIYHGLMLVLQDETTEARMEFGSSDNGDTDLHPRLVVNLVTPALVVDLEEENSKLYTTAGDGHIDITVSGGATPYTYSWSPGSATTQDVSSLSPGTYTVTVTDLVENETTLQVKIIDDASYNWGREQVYNENGDLVADRKVYRDHLSRDWQALSLNPETGVVMASQTLYDAYGRAAIQTLPAPVGPQLVINEDFIEDSNGNDYDWNDFDGSATTWNPNAVNQDKTYSLGHYYSDSSSEAYVATTDFPYVRQLFSPDYTARLTAGTKAGDELRMGKGRETRVFYLKSYYDLVPVYGTNKSYRVKTTSGDPLSNTPMAITDVTFNTQKVISWDEDRNTTITYRIGDRIIATARGNKGNGTAYISSEGEIAMQGGDGSSTFHIPEGEDDQLELPLVDYTSSFVNGEPQTSTTTNSDITYTFYDLIGDTTMVSGTDYSINTSTRKVSFLNDYASGDKLVRIKAEFATSFVNTVNQNGGVLPSNVPVEYRLDYEQWQVNYYDLAGRLRKTVTPEGFVSGGSHTMSTTFDYDQYGHLIGRNDPDEGKTEMVYNSEGLLRFTQDAVQRANDRFSYVNYDDVNRPVESGEYTSGTMEFQNYYEDYTITSGDTSVLEVLDDNDGLNDAHCDDRNYIAYYELDDADDINHSGNSWTHKSHYSNHAWPHTVAKTWNDDLVKWYGYDNRGRLSYLVQQVLDSDYTSKTSLDEEFKTLDYTYNDSTGQLWKKEYQKRESSEYLKATYAYNDAGQLTSTTVADNSIDDLAEAAFEYYPIGAMKRQTLGDRLQGIDHVYTVNGELKSVNHPALDQSSDPGEDGLSSGPHSDMQPDLFAFALDYHLNDYERAGTDIASTSTSSSKGHFNGMIQALRWKNSFNRYINGTTALYGETETDIELMYQYTYDDNLMLAQALFGTYDQGLSSFTSREDYAVWGATVSSQKEDIEYDQNGNIVTLQRNGYEITSSNWSMDHLSYTYDNTKLNRLNSITDNVSGQPFGSDFTTTGSDNFTYDANGRLTASDADGITTIAYYHTGKTKSVDFSGGAESNYLYGPEGKKFRSATEDALGSTVYNWYFKDENGTLVALHRRDEGDAPNDDPDLLQQPLQAFGVSGALHKSNGKVTYDLSDHLGNVRVSFSEVDDEVYISDFADTDGWLGFNPSSNVVSQNETLIVDDANPGGGAYKEVSLSDDRDYRITFDVDMGTSDKVSYKISTTSAGTTSYATGSTTTGGTQTLEFTATSGGNHYLIVLEDDNGHNYEFEITDVEVRDQSRLRVESWADYYPFGEKLPGRQLTGSETQLFGYQGKEKAENSSWYQFELRMYNPSLGRWMTTDPYQQFATPYQAMGNNPVSYVDPDGGWCDCRKSSVWLARYRAQRLKLHNRDMNDRGYYGSNEWKHNMEVIYGYKMRYIQLHPNSDLQLATSYRKSNGQMARTGYWEIDPGWESPVVSHLTRADESLTIVSYWEHQSDELLLQAFNDQLMKDLDNAIEDISQNGLTDKVVIEGEIEVGALIINGCEGCEASAYFAPEEIDMRAIIIAGRQAFLNHPVTQGVVAILPLPTASKLTVLVRLYKGVRAARSAGTMARGVRSIGAAAKGFSRNIKSVNQLNKLIRKGKLPKTIKRFDKGKTVGELDHVHFSDGSALNINGTWKHGFKVLTRKEIETLSRYGWTIPR